MSTIAQAKADRDAIAALIAQIAEMQVRVVELRPRHLALSWVLNSLRTTHYDLAVALKEAK
jgi:hypothetical protein